MYQYFFKVIRKEGMCRARSIDFPEARAKNADSNKALDKAKRRLAAILLDRLDSGDILESPQKPDSFYLPGGYYASVAAEAILPPDRMREFKKAVKLSMEFSQ